MSPRYSGARRRPQQKAYTIYQASLLGALETTVYIQPPPFGQTFAVCAGRIVLVVRSLRKIKAKVDRNEDLTREETAAWNRCAAMLVMGGDLSDGKRDPVVVKNVPKRQQFTIVETVDTYDFRIDEGVGDYGQL
jgi:hypothetical protein